MRQLKISNYLLLIILINFFWLCLAKNVKASENNLAEFDRQQIQLSSTALDIIIGVEKIRNNTIDSESNPTQLKQTTDVIQLRDVAPTDWAYEALRSLVERYGCIGGFPNQTYRGSQALTRYEFAAGLNSCLNQIERLIASTETISEADLAAIERLSREFAVELATVEGRVDNLEGRTAVLEDNQFSTTTKLVGNVWFNLTGAAADGDVLVETNDLSVSFCN